MSTRSFGPLFLDFSSQVPIYLQISQAIEDDIIKGVFEEETQIPSTTEISVNYKINPATVAKGFNLLVDEGIIFKKRGVGMFVSKTAKTKLLKERRKAFYEKHIVNLIEEAENLGIEIDEVIKMIEGGNQQ